MGLILTHIMNASTKYKCEGVAVVPKQIITLDIVFTNAVNSIGTDVETEALVLLSVCRNQYVRG